MAGTTFLDEWTKLQTARQVQVTSEEAWEACLQAAHDEVLARRSTRTYCKDPAGVALVRRAPPKTER